MTAARRGTRAALSTIACLLALSACTVTAADLPMPGGGIDGETYQLHAEFSDALNLPEKAHVKLGGVRVGTVTDIATENYRAHIRMNIRRDVELGKGTRAELRQQTPLGDIFVALQPPDDAPTTTTLADGDTIDIDHTASAATVEDSLTAMALLINGGGLGQLGDIVKETNAVLDGRAPAIRNVVGELGDTLQTLNARTGDIDRILKASNGLTTLAKRRRGTIDAALSGFGPAIDTIAANTGRFRRTLAKAAGAAESTGAVLDAAEADLKSTLLDSGNLLEGFAGLDKDLRPTLRTLVALGKHVHNGAKGEAGAGELTIDAADLLDSLRADGAPGVDDVTRSASANLGTLLRFLEQVTGGTR